MCSQEDFSGIATYKPTKSLTLRDTIMGVLEKSNTLLLTYNTCTIGIVKDKSMFYLINSHIVKISLKTYICLSTYSWTYRYIKYAHLLDDVCKNNAFLITPLDIVLQQERIYRRDKCPWSENCFRYIAEFVGKCKICRRHIWNSNWCLFLLYELCLHPEAKPVIPTTSVHKICTFCLTQYYAINATTDYLEIKYQTLDKISIYWIQEIFHSLWRTCFIEKCLIALIQIFGTVATLPGGQFASVDILLVLWNISNLFDVIFKLLFCSKKKKIILKTSPHHNNKALKMKMQITIIITSTIDH